MRVDLHTHTADDPVDFIPHTTVELIERAAAVGLDAVAITLHERQRPVRDLAAFAADLGVVLIPGLERTIHGRHVLLLNFPASEAEAIDSFEALARMKAHHPQGLVVAPHPFYPHGCCLRELMNRHTELFDAVECNAFYTASTRLFNGAAIRWASAHGKPVVANSDAHRLPILGASCSNVDADPNPDAICAAIRDGRVTLETRPLSVLEAGTYFGSLLAGQFKRPAHSGRPLPATA